MVLQGALGTATEAVIALAMPRTILLCSIYVWWVLLFPHPKVRGATETAMVADMALVTIQVLAGEMVQETVRLNFLEMATETVNIHIVQ